MAEAINFGSAQRSGLEAMAGAGVVSMNVYTDDLGCVRRRPGLVAADDLTSSVVDSGGIDGLFVTEDGETLAVAGGAKRWVYVVGESSARRLSTPLQGLGRPTFAQTEMLVVLAGGGNLLRYGRQDKTLAPLGGDPPKASHVVAANLRLLANDVVVDRTKVRFSDISQGTLSYSGHEDWTATNPVTAGAFTAEAKPDPVLAIGENTNEIFVWGTNSLQMFGPDPSFGFAPTGTREYGLGAAHSVIKADQHFFWLDQYRRFVMSDGRSMSDVSGDIAADLDTISRVDDCFGYRVVTGNLDAVVWTFPTDGRTFAFQKGSGWAQWSGFSGNWTRFSVASSCYRPQDGVTLAGTTDGHVAQFDVSATSDLGEAINAYTVTGYLDRGTDQRKWCRCVRLALRRGTVTGATGPQAWLAWRDRPGPWQGRVPVDLGRSNDTEIVVEVRSLGVYRRRQWMFEFSGSEELVLVRASEDFEVGDQ
jgi:hypothetical protein